MAQESSVQINSRQVREATVVDLNGRLDTLTSGGAYDELLKIVKSGAINVVLNLENMEYVSSAGLRVVLTVAKLLKSSKGDLKICCANGIVREVLDTSGFNLIIDIHDTEAGALAALDPP